MKVSGKCLKSGMKDGKFLTVIQLNGKVPKPGDSVVCKWGKTRSLSQNALLWKFYEFLMDDCGMKDEYATPEELHETFKAAFLSTKRFGMNDQEFLKIGSTAHLDKIAFGEYLEKVNRACIEWFGIDTAPFWKEYGENYAVK